ncbi:MAG: peptidoglycan bridge formation glycyltransferase FemA/FemB family protein [Pseudomonadota bacterium]
MAYSATFSSLTQTKPKVWDDWLIAETQPAYQHGFGYAHVQAAKGAQPQFWSVKHGASVCAQGVVFVYRFGPLQAFVLPAGLAVAEGAEEAQAYQALVQSLERTRLSVTALSAPPGALERKPAMTGGVDAVWQLGESPDIVRTQMRQKWRNSLNKAAHQSLEIEHASPKSAAMTWLEMQEGAQRSRKNYKMLAPTLARDIANAPGRTSAFCIAAKGAGQYVAAASFVCFGSAATYYASVTLPSGRRMCAQHAILHEAACQALKAGIQKINLGLIDTHRSPGLARFKLGTGAIAVDRPHTTVLIGRAD